MKGDAVNQVSTLKQGLNGEIVVPASRKLLRTLIDNDLADEIRLLIYPFVLGTGQRLFGESGDKVSLRLVASQTVGDSLPYITYQVVRAT